MTFDSLVYNNNDSEYNVLMAITQELIKESEYYDQCNEFINEAATDPDNETKTEDNSKPIKVGMMAKIKIFVNKCWNTIIAWFKKMKNSVVSKMRQLRSKKLKKAIAEIDKKTENKNAKDENIQEKKTEVVDEYATYYQEEAGNSPKKPSEDPARKEIFEACKNKTMKFHTRLNISEFKKNITYLCEIFLKFQKEFINISNNFQLTSKANKLNRITIEMKHCYDNFYGKAIWPRDKSSFKDTDKIVDFDPNNLEHVGSAVSKKIKNIGASIKYNSRLMIGDAVTLHDFANYYDDVMEECNKACKRLITAESMIIQSKSKFDIVINDLIGNDNYSVSSKFGSDVISNKATDTIDWIKKIFESTLKCISYANRIINDIEQELNTEVSVIEDFAKHVPVDPVFKATNDRKLAKEEENKEENEEEEENTGNFIYINKKCGISLFNNFKEMLDNVKDVLTKIGFSTGGKIDITVKNIYEGNGASSFKELRSNSNIGIDKLGLPKKLTVAKYEKVDPRDKFIEHRIGKRMKDINEWRWTKRRRENYYNANKQYSDNPEYIGSDIAKDLLFVMTVGKGDDEKILLANCSRDTIKGDLLTDKKTKKNYNVFKDKLFAKYAIDVTDKDTGIIKDGKFKGNIVHDNFVKNKLKCPFKITWPENGNGHK